MIRLILAEDHQAFIDGISAYLQYDEDIKLIATVNNGQELLKSVRQLIPDVVITDLRMPVLDGMEAIIQIRKEFEHIKIIALTMFDNIETVQKVMKAGANGYLLKNSGLTIMKEAIKRVLKGEVYFDPNLSISMALGINKPQNATKSLLSKREKEILHLIAQGKSSHQIADELFVSKTTIDTHRKNMCRKLGINGSNALLQYALEKKY